jgi:hypothetical protein
VQHSGLPGSFLRLCSRNNGIDQIQISIS